MLAAPHPTMRKDPDGSGSAGVQDYYFHQDDLFNVVLAPDSAGDAAERYEYGDYGAPFYFTGAGSSTPSSAINNTRLFNGREWDDESRFYYYRTRHLEPTMGRFTTRDTIGVWGDAANVGNGLAYVGSRPLSGLDPFGLAQYYYDGGFSPPGGFLKFYHFRSNPSSADQVVIGGDFLDSVRSNSEVDSVNKRINGLVARLIRLAEEKVQCDESMAVKVKGKQVVTSDLLQNLPTRLTLQRFTLSWDISCEVSKKCPCGPPGTLTTKCERKWAIHDTYDFEWWEPYGWGGTPFDIEGTWEE